MGQLVALVIGGAALVLFIWLFFVPPKGAAANSDDAVSADDRQVATLIGLTGGTIEDAAIARLRCGASKRSTAGSPPWKRWESWQG
jgi:hypothetical protein